MAPTVRCGSVKCVPVLAEQQPLGKFWLVALRLGEAVQHSFFAVGVVEKKGGGITAVVRCSQDGAIRGNNDIARLQAPRSSGEVVQQGVGLRVSGRAEESQ